MALTGAHSECNSAVDALIGADGEEVGASAKQLTGQYIDAAGVICNGCTIRRTWVAKRASQKRSRIDAGEHAAA
jgi:hypothetical protein